MKRLPLHASISEKYEEATILRIDENHRQMKESHLR